MRSPVEIVEAAPGTCPALGITATGGAVNPLGGACLGLIGSGAAICGACGDSLPSADLDHIECLPQDAPVTPGQGAGVLVRLPNYITVASRCKPTPCPRLTIRHGQAFCL